ncbi:MAG: hypothetical protein ABFD49_11460 [Armatimonadota bacterium]|nr:hypothetical protein [bacterium]
MLVYLVDVISCENPKCREFAKLVPVTQGMTSYYCPLCEKISYLRTIDATLASSPENYKAYIERTLLTAEAVGR